MSADPQTVAAIPWAHRRSIGHVRAYFRTVVLATVHPTPLAAGMARPVPWVDAVAFRRVTVAIAVVPVAAVATTATLLPGGLLADAVHHPRVWWAELLLVPVAWFSGWLALIAASGVASIWLRQRSVPVARQERAVAISLYACAPLAWMPLPAAIAAVGLIGTSTSLPVHLDDSASAAFLWTALVMASLAVGFWATATDAVYRRASGRSHARSLPVSVANIVLGCLVFCLFGVGVPLAYLFLALVFKTVH